MIRIYFEFSIPPNADEQFKLNLPPVQVSDRKTQIVVTPNQITILYAKALKLFRLQECPNARVLRLG